VDRRNRPRLAAVIALFALVLAACGAPATDAPPAGRTITHAMGTTEVPANPQRVVVLDTGELDAVTALGITPVGATQSDAVSGYPRYLSGDVTGVESVGRMQAPDLEKIASLQPDLILSSKIRHEKIYEQLSGIAPTVFAETVGLPWKDNFLLDARALNREADAQRMLTEYEQRADRLGASIGNPAATRVSVVRFLGDEVRLYAAGSFIGTVLADVGYGRPPEQQAAKTFVGISAEQLARAGGDVVFYSAYGPAGEAQQQAVTSGPLWQSLDAVRAGRARPVSDDHWILGIGIRAANLVLRDLETAPPRP